MEFRSVVCGVDRSPQGQTAAARAARLATRAGQLTLMGIDEVTVAGGAMGAGAVVVRHTSETQDAVARAQALVEGEHPNVRAVIEEGAPAPALLAATDRTGADLLVVGTHETGRVAGVLLGSTATLVLHEAPCSVLVARGVAGSEWPGSIVVGVDGSDEARVAYTAAVELAERFGAPLRTLASVRNGASTTLARARALTPDLEESLVDPVDMLVAASATADLVVVGSRGLRGLKAIGSVSERVAHEALCSVLVARSRGR